jgi:hypothetical protein
MGLSQGSEMSDTKRYKKSGWRTRVVTSDIEVGKIMPDREA